MRRSIGLLGMFGPALFAGSMALAQTPSEPADHVAHHPDQQTGQMQPNPQMTGGCPTMGNMMGQMPMMGQGMMGPGMMQGGMGPGMMQGGMGPSMMQGGMSPGMMQGGMGVLFGSRVTPMMNLSVDDVRAYLTAQLDRLNNKRLKIGDVKTNDADITADIVTVDNSLVQRIKVNRHTGAIEYQN